MQTGDRVTVKRTRQAAGPEGNEVVAEDREGVVVAVRDACELYRRKPTYQPGYKGERKETKFPAGAKIVQVKLDGEDRARNFPESEVSVAG